MTKEIVFYTNMADQLIFKFPKKKIYKKEDFYVSSSNHQAYDFINSWPKWIKRIANIFGPPRSGKTHLADIFLSKNKGIKQKASINRRSILKIKK